MIPFLIFAAILIPTVIFGVTLGRRITFPNAFTQDPDNRDRGEWNWAGPGGVLIVILVILGICWLLGIRFGVNT